MDEPDGEVSDAFDATAGDFPRYTQISHNLVREIGLWEKQSSAWFQAKTMQTTLADNIFFNGPRAGINFNDGFGGGNTIARNVLFNFCRESSDHGPFNSWDRNMYLVRQPGDDGSPSALPQFNTIEQNLMIANYQSQEAIDNDDGSGFYHTRRNVIIYGRYGQKADMAGHDNYHVDNLYAYVYPVCYVDLGGGEVANISHRDHHQNNTCIQGMDSSTYAGIDCKGDSASRPIFSNNTIYNPSGVTSVCGMPLKQWQALGNDPLTTVHRGIPGDAAIIGWAAQKLGVMSAQV